jgi:hypothetical protein
MPALSSRETIPNFPLNGQELALFTREVLKKTLLARNWSGRHSEILIAALQNALETDWLFKPQFIYPNVSFEIAIQSHCVEHGTEEQFACDLGLVFKFPNNASFPEGKPFVRRPVGVSSPPIEKFEPEDLHTVDCFVVSVKVENPNLVRVHCNLPIVIAEKIQPKHGELFGKIQNHEVRYDPKDFEELPAWMVLDRSREFADMWDLKRVSVKFLADEEFNNLNPTRTESPAVRTHAEIAAEIHRETVERAAQSTPENGGPAGSAETDPASFSTGKPTGAPVLAKPPKRNRKEK